MRKVKAGKKAAGKKKGGVVEEWEFKVHFDADDEVCASFRVVPSRPFNVNCLLLSPHGSVCL